MRDLIRWSLLAMAMVLALPQSSWADKKEKKKEKKPYEWVMPNLSGNEDMDKYLLACDTMFNQVKTYKEGITFYEVKKIQITDENGTVVTDENGNPKEVYAVVDGNNTIRGAGEALAQYLQMTLAGTNLILDMTNIGLLTTAAGLALPKLGLGAITYGKYIKAGPKLIGMASSEIKGIVKDCRAQARNIKAYKKNFSEKGELLDPQADLSNLDGTSLADVPTVQKPQAEYEKEILSAAEEDKNASAVDDDAFDGAMED